MSVSDSFNDALIYAQEAYSRKVLDRLKIELRERPDFKLEESRTGVDTWLYKNRWRLQIGLTTHYDSQKLFFRVKHSKGDRIVKTDKKFDPSDMIAGVGSDLAELAVNRIKEELGSR